MAVVDFTNAVLDVDMSHSDTFPMNLGNYLYLNQNAVFVDSSQRGITTNANKTIITNTPSKVSILYTGSFTASGTEFYIGYGYSGYYTRYPWRVSNISFSSGDTYSFVIDIETSGNS